MPKAEPIIFPFLPIYSSQSLSHHSKWHLHLPNCPHAIISKSYRYLTKYVFSLATALPSPLLHPSSLDYQDSLISLQLPLFFTLVHSPYSSLSDFSKMKIKLYDFPPQNFLNGVSSPSVIKLLFLIPRVLQCVVFAHLTSFYPLFIPAEALWLFFFPSSTPSLFPFQDICTCTWNILPLTFVWVCPHHSGLSSHESSQSPVLSNLLNHLCLSPPSVILHHSILFQYFQSMIYQELKSYLFIDMLIIILHWNINYFEGRDLGCLMLCYIPVI